MRRRQTKGAETDRPRLKFTQPALYSTLDISDSEIDYPKAYNINLLLALTQQSFNGYVDDVKSGGLVIYDEDKVKEVKEGDYRLVGLPIISTATGKIGKAMVANIVSLGVIVELTEIVSKNSIEKAVLKRAPRGTEELNKKALHAGYELAKAVSK